MSLVDWDEWRMNGMNGMVDSEIYYIVKIGDLYLTHDVREYVREVRLSPFDSKACKYYEEKYFNGVGTLESEFLKIEMALYKLGIRDIKFIRVTKTVTFTENEVELKAEGFHIKLREKE